MALQSLSCATTPDGTRNPSVRDPVRVLNTHSGADSVRLLEIATVLQIIDPEFYDKLPDSLDEGALRELVDRHQRFNQATWRQALANLEYCRTVCETPLYLPVGVRDARWRPFLLNGAPSVEWVTETLFRGNSGTQSSVDCFLYTWESGEGTTLRSDTVGGYPVAEITKRREITTAPRPVFPIVDYATFRNPDQSLDVGISAWILGDQLNQGTIDHGILEMEALIYDGDSLVQKDSIRAKLDAMRELLMITANPRDIATMGYFNFAGIHPGDYTVEFRVRGGHHNSGSFHLDLPVPSPRVTGSASDLMIIADAPSGEVVPGIMRGERSFYANPLWVLRRRDGEGVTFLPYIEFDPAGNSRYRVEVSLTPIPVGSKRRNGTASIGKLTYLKNVDGTIYPGWASPIDINNEATQEPGRSNVVFAGEYTASGQVGVFNELVHSGKVHRGKYWLRFDIRDPSGHPLGSALATVEIR